MMIKIREEEEVGPSATVSAPRPPLFFLVHCFAPLFLSLHPQTLVLGLRLTQSLFAVEDRRKRGSASVGTPGIGCGCRCCWRFSGCAAATAVASLSQTSDFRLLFSVPLLLWLRLLPPGCCSRPPFYNRTRMWK